MQLNFEIISFAFCISSLLVFALRQVRKTSFKFKKHFVVYSGKSDSGAQLLGGLPVSMAMLTGILLVSAFGYEWRVTKYLLGSFFLSSAFIISYGYLDDRFELRPIVKLAAQVLAVFSFSLVNSLVLGDYFSTIMFIGLMFFGIGTLNGTNLLDGLDMMTVKISCAVYLTYAFIGILYDSQTVLNYSLIFMACLLPFTFYNKFPSKMHLGEIGGTFIGLSYLFLFTAAFKDIRLNRNFVDAFILCIFPATISMSEVGISFMRRIYNGKSPFIGDRFHLHHIFRNYYNLSVPATTYLLSISYGAILLTGLSCMFFTNIPKVLTYAALCIGLGGFQLYYGKRYWIKKSSSTNLKNILTSLQKEDVFVIDSSMVDKFEFKVLKDKSDKIIQLDDYKKKESDAA